MILLKKEKQERTFPIYLLPLRRKRSYMTRKPNILWFNEIRNRDVSRVGGKNASLGEMYQMLRSKGVAIPNGFAVTADAFFYFLKSAGLDRELKKLTTHFNTQNAR